MTKLKQGRMIKIAKEGGGYGYRFDPDASPTTEEMLARAATALAEANQSVRELTAEVEEYREAAEALRAYEKPAIVKSEPVVSPWVCATCFDRGWVPAAHTIEGQEFCKCPLGQKLKGETL